MPIGASPADGGDRSVAERVAGGRGAATRERLVSVGWQLVGQMSLQDLLTSVTAAKVVNEAGVTSGAFFHHFRNHAEYVEALVEALYTPEHLGPVATLAEDRRGSSVEITQRYVDWPDREEERRFLRRLMLLWSRTGRTMLGATTLEEALDAGYWRALLEHELEPFRDLVHRFGRTVVAPFDDEQAFVLAHAWQLGYRMLRELMPDQADAAFYREVHVRLLSTLTTSALHPHTLEDREIEARPPEPPAPVHLERRRALAQAALELFADDWQDVPMTAIAATVDCELEELVATFGTARRVAAEGLAGWVPEPERVPHPDAASPRAALVMLLEEFLSGAVRHPACAAALLEERNAAAHRYGREFGPADIRELVPLGVLALKALDGVEMSPMTLVEMWDGPRSVVDTALVLCAGGAGDAGDIARAAVRLLPPGMLGEAMP